jgi:D-glycero-D-manno-heptose 1,7-bisphosphate phosphatase
MGKLERHEQVQADIENGLVASRNLALAQRAIFLDRDGVINIDSDLIKHPDEMVLYPDATKSIQALHSAGFVVVVVTNQSVVARGLTDLKGIEAIHARMERLLAEEGAFVDQISFCPHHPDKGFPEEVTAFKVECHCRKPKPGMLLDAASRFNIDCSNSWMVGDSERDILAGQAAGCRTIRVKTGHGLKPSTVVPDAYVAGIWEATTHILAAK